MGIIFGGIGLALLCVVLGIVLILREVPALKLNAKKLEVSLALIPIAQAARDLERLQRSLDGLQLLTTRFERIKTKFSRR